MSEYIDPLALRNIPAIFEALILSSNGSQMPSWVSNYGQDSLDQWTDTIISRSVKIGLKLLTDYPFYPNLIVCTLY